MQATPRPARHPKRPMGLRLLAVLSIPVLLMLHAPVLAALVPGALWTIASLESVEDQQRALPAAEIVTTYDELDLRRIAAATPVAASSRRIS